MRRNSENIRRWIWYSIGLTEGGFNSNYELTSKNSLELVNYGLQIWFWVWVYIELLMDEELWVLIYLTSFEDDSVNQRW